MGALRGLDFETMASQKLDNLIKNMYGGTFCKIVHDGF